jgi:hypothetical protein
MTDAAITPEHPLYHPLKLQISTPAVDQLYETLMQWLWTGATGGFIEGQPRAGKTTAIKMMGTRLYSRQGWHIPSHIFSVPPRDRGTIQSLYRNLCISADIPINKNKNTNSDLYLENFYHFLMDMAATSKSDQVVLFVDETQRLKINQLEAFAELHDLMEKNSILLSVIYTGNDTECDKLLLELESHARRHILGRFFTRRTSFQGICNKKQLALCLAEYDTMRFPEHTGPTYVETCLPEASANGFKLQSLADEMWDTYKTYQTDYGLGPWNMKYFSSSIMVLLLDYLPNEGIDAFCQEMFECCINVSGLIPETVRQVS